jgi:hypothetical protein
MTPNYDHATLFVPPAVPRAAGTPRSVVDHGAEAMRKLCHPFAVHPVPARVSAEASDRL